MELSWILPGIAALIAVFFAGLLLQENIIAIVLMIGQNPGSFITGIVAGIGTGYVLFTGYRHPVLRRIHDSHD